VVSGTPKITPKLVPGASWGAPGRPRSSQGLSGASQVRPGSAPGAPRECPGALKDVPGCQKERPEASRNDSRRPESMPSRLQDRKSRFVFVRLAQETLSECFSVYFCAVREDCEPSQVPRLSVKIAVWPLAPWIVVNAVQNPEFRPEWRRFASGMESRPPNFLRNTVQKPEFRPAKSPESLGKSARSGIPSGMVFTGREFSPRGLELSPKPPKTTRCPRPSSAFHILI